VCAKPCVDGRRSRSRSERDFLLFDELLPHSGGFTPLHLLYTLNCKFGACGGLLFISHSWGFDYSIFISSFHFPTNCLRLSAPVGWWYLHFCYFIKHSCFLSSSTPPSNCLRLFGPAGLTLWRFQFRITTPYGFFGVPSAKGLILLPFMVLHHIPRFLGLRVLMHYRNFDFSSNRAPISALLRTMWRLKVSLVVGGSSFRH